MLAVFGIGVADQAGLGDAVGPSEIISQLAPGRLKIKVSHRQVDFVLPFLDNTWTTASFPLIRRCLFDDMNIHLVVLEDWNNL